MPLDRHHQDYQSERAERHWRLDTEFLRGTIGKATYLRSLFILGYAPDEARAELALLDRVKYDYEEERLKASKEYLHARQAH